MRVRCFVRFIPLGIAALLGACSSGAGSSGVAPLPLSSASPAATAAPPVPTSSPTPSGALHSTALGMTTTAIGSRTESIQNNVARPVPLPAQQTVSQISQTTTTLAKSNPFGSGGVDFQSVETASSATQTSSITYDGWYDLVPAGALQNFVLYGVTQTDNDPTTPYTMQIRYAQPLVLDMTGSSAPANWSNGPAATIAESVAGTTTSRTYSADGSYVETDKAPDGSVQTITENADGSGSFLSGPSGGSPTGYFFSAPIRGVSGQVGAFLRIDFTNPLGTVPVGEASAWYGSIPALYSETNAVTEGATPPAECELPAIGPVAHEVDRTVDRVDTIVGYTEVQKTRSYAVPGIGPVCVLLRDDSSDYYDYTLQSSQAPIFADHPIRTVSIVQNVRVQGASATTSVAARARLAVAGSAKAMFLARIERMRSARSRAYRRLHGGL